MLDEFRPPHFSDSEVLQAMPKKVPVAGPRLAGDVAIAAGRNPLALNETDLLEAAGRLAKQGFIRFELRNGVFKDAPRFFTDATCIDRPHYVFTRLV